VNLPSGVKEGGKSMNSVTREDVAEKVIKIVSEEVGIPEKNISRESAFETDLPIDSLGMVEMTMKIEEAFNLSISDEDVESVETVGDLIDYIKAHVKE
jgi:acyl carrier protein